MVECTGLENRQSRKVLVGSNPTASANTLISRSVTVAAALLAAGCMHFSSVPGETRTEGTQQRAISKRIFELGEAARPDCGQRRITGSEILDLHPDAKPAVERWTLTQCGQRTLYLVRFPLTGRGTGFVVSPEK